MQPFHLLAKPAGPRCNMRCAYCFYLEKERLYPDRTGSARMSDELLEVFVRDYLRTQPTAEVGFSWQGGEPTLMGLPFFERVVALQARYTPPGKKATNALQTNGLALDDDWCRFLARHEFLVGISIDGPRDLHDGFRVDRGGRGSFDRVAAAMERCRRHGVAFNTMTVVHRGNSQQPERVYRALKELGATHMQFIPLLERMDGGELAGPPQPDRQLPVAPWSCGSDELGSFLCGIFDLWVRSDIGEIFVQPFDVALSIRHLGRSSICAHDETCGDALVVEHNGDVYACDHYVYPEHRLGNLLRTPLAQLADDPRQRAFGAAKRDELPTACRDCQHLPSCRGGCPKHRSLRSSGGEPGLNYFCSSYRRFFERIGPHIEAMHGLLLQGKPAAAHMRQLSSRRDWTEPRRNDPCPCGSGLKYKRCCALRK